MTGVLGTSAVSRTATRHWASPLRVLAYHGIGDRDRFGAHLNLIASSFHPVSESDVRAAAATGERLPDRAVWLTFDDGDPSVVAVGLEVLAQYGLTATVYVCPGLIEQEAAPWWTVVEAAGRAGAGAEVDGQHLLGLDLVRALKKRPDGERRAVVEHLRQAGEGQFGDGPRALTIPDLERWVDAGNEVGNHTWDHPCLDQCSPEDQTDQVRRTDAWLRRFRPDVAPSFAYPNGDHTLHAESVLQELGYDTALLFDHALCDPDASPLRTSRLRLDADAPLGRARAVLSGAHSTLLRAAG